MNVDQSTSGTNGNPLGRKWRQFYSRFFLGRIESCYQYLVCVGDSWPGSLRTMSSPRTKCPHWSPPSGTVIVLNQLQHPSASFQKYYTTVFLHFFRRNSYFKAVLRSQNYFISAPAPSLLFLFFGSSSFRFGPVLAFIKWEIFWFDNIQFFKLYKKMNIKRNISQWWQK